MKNKYFWDKHPIIFGLILFIFGFVMPAVLERYVSRFVLLLVMLCMPAGAIFISIGIKKRRQANKFQGLYRTLGQMQDDTNHSKTEAGYENLYQSDVVKKVIDLNKAKSNLTISQYNDLIEFYDMYTKEAGRYIRVNNKQQYDKTIREMIRTFSTFVPFEKVTALSESEYKPYIDEINNELNIAINIEDKLIAYANISNYPFVARFSKDPFLKMVSKSTYNKEYWGLVIIDKTKGISEAMNSLNELSNYLVLKSTNLEQLNNISKELIIVCMHFLNKKEINDNEFSVFKSSLNNQVEERKKELDVSKVIPPTENQVINDTISNNIECELENYANNNCVNYKDVLKQNGILGLLTKTLHAKEFAALAIMKQKLGNQKTLDKYIEFINYLIDICDDFQDAANWSIEIITFNGYLRAVDVISKETSEQIIAAANKGLDAVQQDESSKFRSITRIQEKYERLNTGNQRVEFSHFEIVDLLINLSDAQRNLTNNQYMEVLNKYNSYRYDTELHSMNLAEYQAYAGNVVVRGFNQIAPYEKYSGQDEEETKKLIDEINEGYEENLEMVKKYFKF